MGKIYKNQAITRFTLDTEADLTGATGYFIKYIKPDGTTTGQWAAACTDNRNIYYDFTASDLDQTGIWTFWAYITFSGGGVPGEALTIRVYAEGE